MTELSVCFPVVGKSATFITVVTGRPGNRYIFLHTDQRSVIGVTRFENNGGFPENES